MTEEQKPADPAGSEEVIDQSIEGQDEGQTAEDSAEKPEPTEDEKEAERKRESAKERREREKAYKARLREEKEAALQKAAAAEDRLQKLKHAGTSSAEPKEADFADYSEFVAAKVLWRHMQGQSEREAGQVSQEAEHARGVAERLAAQERAVAFQAYDAARQEARTRIADFDAVVGQEGLFPVNSHLPDLILQSDASADLAYEIAKDRNLHDALLRASPVEAARIIGRIEAKLSSPPARTKTSAPDPISPVRGPAAAGKSPDTMSQAEFNAWREAGGTF